MAPKSVLIVEEEPVIARVLADILRDGGFDVTVAEDSDHAYGLLVSTKAFDALVTAIKVGDRRSGSRPGQGVRASPSSTRPAAGRANGGMRASLAAF